MDSRDTSCVDMEELVAEALVSIEDEGGEGLDRVCAQHPDYADALRSRVGWLVEHGLADVGGRSRDVPERLGDFRLLETLGSGAMGVVYRATDMRLGREVALKVVRPEQLFFPGARERFEREVSIIAGLQHPGIVPVHSVGEEDGVPYFAMELVQGATLDQVIEHVRLGGKSLTQLEGRDFEQALLDLVGGDAETADAESMGTSELFHGSWTEVCARVVREMAEALEYAHRRGVLHRDIKPSNVMVTPGGRVLVLDFGLSSSEGHGRLTKTGVGVGSLAYMAPEQVSGKADLDGRADVWSLGVTLYELLMLDLPFKTQTEVMLRGEILRGSLPKMRGGSQRVSWELETIVQTSVEVDRSRRYRRPGTLARDLGLALDNRPIEARRAGAVLRSKRWIQRHPAAAVAWGLFVTLVVVAPLGFLVQQLRTNRALSNKSAEVAKANLGLERSLRETQLQRDEAQRARDRAVRCFDRASEAVDVMLSELGGEVLRDVPQAEPAREAMLEAALRLNEELIEEPESGDREEYALAATLHRIAEIQAMLGRRTQAEEKLREELTVLAQLAASDSPFSVGLQQATAHRHLSVMLTEAEEWEEALAEGRIGIGLLERIDSQSPESYARALGHARLELGRTLRFAGQAEEGRAEIEHGIDLLRQAVADDPEDRVSRTTLAKALHQRGSADAMVYEGPPDAEELELRRDVLEESIGLFELGLEEDGSPLRKYQLAHALMTRGTLELSAGDLRSSYENLDRCEQLVGELSRAFPSFAHYRELHGSCLYSMAGCHVRGIPGDPRPILDEACDELTAAVEIDPTPGNRQKLTLAAVLSGELELELGPAKKARERFLMASDLGRELHQDAEPTEQSKMVLRRAIGQGASAALELGWLNEATEEAPEILGLDPAPPEVLYVSWYFARAASSAIERHIESGYPVGPWIERSVELARESESLGVPRAAVVDSFLEAELAAIRGRDEFYEYGVELGIVEARAADE